jgi:hypothetical protein
MDTTTKRLTVGKQRQLGEIGQNKAMATSFKNTSSVAMALTKDRVQI